MAYLTATPPLFFSQFLAAANAQGLTGLIFTQQQPMGLRRPFQFSWSPAKMETASKQKEPLQAGDFLRPRLIKELDASSTEDGSQAIIWQSSVGFRMKLHKRYKKNPVGFNFTAQVTYLCALRALDAAWTDVKLHQGPKMCQLTNQDLLGKVLRRSVRSGVLIQVAHFYILVTTTISTGCFPSWRYPHVLSATATFVSAMQWMRKTATTVCCLRWMATLCGTRLRLGIEIIADPVGMNS